MISESSLLEKAEKSLRTADHMIYITYPLIKDNRILKSVLDQLYSIADNIVFSVLDYEAAHKRAAFAAMQLTSGCQNWILFAKSAPQFSITAQELEKMREFLEIVEKHRASSVEFTRKDRLVFMNNSSTESIGLEQMKIYLNVLKAVLRKAREKIAVPVQQA
jgi:hypothetical protein